LGVGVEDLIRIALSSLATVERRAVMPMLIEVMYESLVENLNGAQPPYPLDQLKLIADLIYPPCAIFFASGCITMIRNAERDPKITEDEKKERVSVMLDKVIGCLEDMVTIDARNEEHMEKLKLLD
ncbi:hypothetical protein PMAYCL1PPCAC_01291, partial [Pristionchus mayeri]